MSPSPPASDRRTSPASGRWARPGGRKVAAVLAILLSLACLIQVNHRARKGRSAILKWAPAFEALDRGEPLYGVGDEGYPTLPLTLLVMRPFHAAGPTLGPLAWAGLKIALAWWMVLTALRLGGGGPRQRLGQRAPADTSDFPPWGVLLVLLFSFRALYSDVQHGNLNVVVGATVVAAAASWSRGQDLRAGVWIGLGTILKLTPLLCVLLFVRKRSARGLLGVGVGLVLFGLVVPGAWVGWARNLELASAWVRQMVLPYLAGRELGIFQTMQLNQSLYGVLARHTTHSVAIEGPPALYINWLDLGPAAFRALHLAASLATLAWLWVSIRPEAAPPRDKRTVLAEFALLALATLLLSERSWKHHYVLLCLPIALLVPPLFGPAGARRRICAWGVGLSALLHGASGEAFLGKRGSDLAEAYGAWMLGAVALLVACGALSRFPARESGH